MIRRLRISLITTAATLALATALAGPVTAQGVPTVDTQNIAQEIRQLQQMLQDFGIQTDLLDNALAQLETLQGQLDQLNEMYASLTGPRSILGLAMGGDLDNLLQANFEDIPGLIRGIQAGDWSSLIGLTRGPCAPRWNRRWPVRASMRIHSARSPPAAIRAQKVLRPAPRPAP
ncbi:type IV secretion system protein [Roseibaca calidilacus]|uniref:type IV secretion system protein n=1 Tax=Roseibaca calidilacus TaxID=1666912 RepID=UPI000AF01B67